MSGHRGTRGVPAAAPPRLLVDGTVAAGLLSVFGSYMRDALTPDGVAYLENAELFAQGWWTEALQGYWSPGYSMLLAPVAWLSGGDRDRLLMIAHIVQIMLGVVALWLAAEAVHRRVPVHAQRVVFWGCTWIILRWLTQELLTPDLLLCVLVLWFVKLSPAATRRGEVWLGLIAGAGFLTKSSIWPWLLVAVALAAARSLRAQSRQAFPATATLVALTVAGAFVTTLSLRADHLTLGSVGPLNVSWYLGDRSRRTPDTDRGPHTAKRAFELPSGLVIAAYDMRPTARTYAPWSDPERWRRGVPASSLPPLNLAEALTSWKQNLGELKRWLLPLGIGLILVVSWSVAPRNDVRRGWLLDRPMLVVGAWAALVFLVLHAEHRLLAPAGLLLLLGAWRNSAETRPRPRFAWLAAALITGVGIQLATYMPQAARRASSKAEYERSIHTFFRETRSRTSARDVVVVGPFGLWMGILWRNQLRAAVQVDEHGALALEPMPDAEQRRWMRAAFGPNLLGVASSHMRREGETAAIKMAFIPF